MHAKRPAPADSILLSLQEARATLGISNGTFQKLLREGRLPVVRLSPRTVRVRRVDLEAFVEEMAGPWTSA